MRQRKTARALIGEWMIPLGILALAFGLGGLIGVLVAGTVEGEGGTLLRQYLVTYFALVAEGVLPSQFWVVVWEQLKLPLCAILLGFSSLGLIGLPILFGIRGFMLTYSVACLWRMFGSNGLVAAGFLFGLTALIAVPPLFVLGVQGMVGSFGLLRRTVGVRGVTLPYGTGFALCCGGCGAVILIAVLVEWGAVPVLLRSVAPLLQ